MQLSEPAALRVGWENRPEPLEARGMVAFGKSATNLAQRLLEYGDDQLELLQGVGAVQTVLILGDAESLPWVDGSSYLGKDPRAPSVLFPTTLRPSIPSELLERVMRATFGAISPCAILPRAIVPYGKAKPLSRSLLKEWLSENP